MRHDTIDCPDAVRASLRWAVAQLRRQPVLFLPGVLWVGSGIRFSYLIFDVLRLVPNLRDPWTIGVRGVSRTGGVFLPVSR